jgi:glycerophosphoryl diester phosphodiesterase
MIVFAHRGASAYKVENTLSAVKMALDMGAQAIEFDIQMTKDRKIVLHHDFNLKNCNLAIRDLNFEDIPAATKGSYCVDSLETVLSAIPKDILVNIEIKSLLISSQGFEMELLAILEKYGRLKNTIISSFDHNCIKRIYELNKNISLGLLFHFIPLDIKNYIKKIGITPYCLNFSIKLVDKDLVERVHSCGSKIFVYTVNCISTANELLLIGVDGIFSDYPDLLK